MRKNYWSNTKLAEYILGIEKIKCGTAQEWDEWETLAKQQGYRYWIAEVGLDKLQNIIYFPVDRFYDVKHYIINRFITKTHALTATKTHIKRGSYCELDTRMLNCLFDALVDFVEIECAYFNYYFMDEDKKKLYNIPFYASFFNIRYPQLGIDYLKWSATLTELSNHQAEAAKTVLELYYWWKKR